MKRGINETCTSTGDGIACVSNGSTGAGGEACTSDGAGGVTCVGGNGANEASNTNNGARGTTCTSDGAACVSIGDREVTAGAGEITASAGGPGGVTAEADVNPSAATTGGTVARVGRSVSRGKYPISDSFKNVANGLNSRF